MISKLNKKNGFTLVEILVVIAVVGILSILAVVALNNAREKSRDAKRISDIRQIQTALQLYFNDNNAYPISAAGTTLGGTGAGTLSSTNGFSDTAAGTTYMNLIPSNSSPGGASYIYTSVDGSTYSITFVLEGRAGELAPGSRTANPRGIQ